MAPHRPVASGAAGSYPTGPVTAAEIDGQRLSMRMSRYKAIASWMAAPVGPAEGNGAFRLQAELPMAGEWSLFLTVRVPGEAKPVRGKVRIWAS